MALPNIVLRCIMGSVMISTLGFLVYLGPYGQIALCMLVQLGCVHEVLTLGMNHCNHPPKDRTFFKYLSWYFYIIFNFLLFGELWLDNFRVLVMRSMFSVVFQHSRLLFFLLYCLGGIIFILNLKKKRYMQHFVQFGWTHLTLLYIVSSTHITARCVCIGSIWFLMSVCLVTMNDITAFFIGVFVGRTPLLELSPKKTWEGFIGGGILTVVFSIFFSYLLAPHQYFICPYVYNDSISAMSLHCETPPAFQKSFLQIPFLGLDVLWYPFVGHSIVFALFATFVAPFGGFFASGLKRAFEVKDFGVVIPGHGGMMDRNDCQFIMAAFVLSYFRSFIQACDADVFLQQILLLPPDQQILIHQNFTSSLIHQKLLNL